jgi:beta-xylosidase
MISFPTAIRIQVYPALLYLVALIGFSCSSNSVATQETVAHVPVATNTISYTNPVLAGDYADPSAVRVGDDYWATATSSEWAPLFPLLHSRNLVDWETVGHVFPDKLPDWAEAHFWAPEIAYEKGRYYIYYTAKKKGGNLCVGVASATSPTGPYTDHGPLVCQEVGSIDGFEIRDEKGDLYLVWKEDGNSRGLPTPIWGQRMNEERTALTGEKFELFRNNAGTWEGGVVEGPAIIKRGDYYFIFYAGDKCCGRECTYAVGVARARSLKGPWEKHEKNPIIQQNEAWKCPGHGTVVSDANGNDYFLYHAYDAKSTVYPGRQGVLDKIEWGDDNWPYFENNAPSTTALVQVGQNSSLAQGQDTKEEFNSGQLAKTWQWPVGQQVSYTLEPDETGTLLLKASPDKVGTVLAKRTRQADYTATAALSRSSVQNGTMAGLTAIGDHDNAVGIALQGKEIILWSLKAGTLHVIARTAAPSEDLMQLRLVTTGGDQMQFGWSTNGDTWNMLNDGNRVDASYLPPWDRGVRVGLTAKGPAGDTAAFDWFHIVNN